MKKLQAAKVPFFVEAWNAEQYPTLLSELRSHGHEVVLHGWRHEIWSKLDLRSNAMSFIEASKL